MSFENSLIFLLLPLPWLIYRYLPANTQNGAALYVPFIKQLENITQDNPVSQSRQLFMLGMLSIIWLLLITSLARPVFIGEPVQLPSEARDLMLAVDISGSMDEIDMRINNQPVRRVDAVKAVVSEFIKRRQGDRIGLILFADNAYLQAPLTYDTRTVAKLLEESRLGFAGQKTAIGDAIGLSVKRLIHRPAGSRVLVLLTDGVNNSGNVEPLAAADIAQENKIKIYTIGIGADEITERSFFGNRTRNPSRNLDEQTLTEIATITGGQYFRARNTKELENIYALLDKIEAVDQESESFRPKKQLFYWPLGLMFILIALIGLIKILANKLYLQQMQRDIDQPYTETQRR